MIKSRAKFIITDTIKSFNLEVVQYFINAINDCIDKKGRVYVALSGGNTPKPIFRIIAEKHKDSVEWGKVSFFWVDERSVSHHHEESNFGTAKELMLKKLPDINYYPIKGYLPPDRAAIEYEKKINQEVPFYNGFPVFDILMLGMGEDGHIASLFPNNKALYEKNRIAVPVWVEHKQTYRITLTLPVLNNSLVRIFAFFGEQKFDFFKQIKESGTAIYPIQLLDYTKGKNNFIIGK